MRCGIAHWALAAVLVTLETSSACSVDRAYIPLTNYELVKITPAIVVTRATGTELRAVSIAVGVDRLRKHVRFEIVEVLKSASLEVGTALTLAGTIEDYQGREQQTTSRVPAREPMSVPASHLTISLALIPCFSLTR